MRNQPTRVNWNVQKAGTHVSTEAGIIAGYPVSVATSFASSSVQAENIAAAKDPTS